MYTMEEPALIKYYVWAKYPNTVKGIEYVQQKGIQICLDIQLILE